MLKSSKLFFVINFLLFSWLYSFGQEDGQYKDVTLDGKPAKLNVVTGEITLVNSKDESIIISDDILDQTNEFKDSLPKNAESNYHIVKENETLLDIANRYKTTLTALKEANNLETTLIDVGQKLRVKNFGVQTQNTADVVAAEPTTVVTSSENYSGTYIVENGDTLYSLGKRYGLTVDELKSKNGLSSSLIKVGQVLNVSHSEHQETLTNKSIWTVSKGDTLYNISKRNGLTVDELKSLNGLTDNLIFIGQILKLR
ncbi:MAG: LysM peptidoglycan-binding domain-containing protein [Winogradskyella sp.]|nr:LysM peptidoglycan-binding domain-containing protein [Winogradskyella sp.]